MSPRKKGIVGGIKPTTALLAGGGLLGLYLITRPAAAGAGPSEGINIFGQAGQAGEAGAPGAPGVPGQSILQTITETITKTAAETTVGVLEVPGAIVFGIPKKIVETSEEQVSQQVFGGATKKDVSAFMATAPPGSVFVQPITYAQFMAEQPIAFRAAATTGNILTGTYAAQYGAYVAEETKKGQIAAGRRPGEFEQRFNIFATGATGPGQAWGGQALIGLGQALTVPFGGGGAAGWGAQTKNLWESVFGGAGTKKKEAAISEPKPTTQAPTFVKPIWPFQSESRIAYGSNMIAKAYG